MTRIIWGTVGQRFYEAGADRGVLFVDGLGVPWNGLKTVQESPTGGDPKPYYLDGIKYLNLAEAEEFEGTIEAFSAPREFAPCDGAQELYAGLSLTQQTRKIFGMSWRTLVGNDTVGLDLAYKIHIVYGALAQPSQRNRATLTQQIDPLGLSWGISTTPQIAPGVKPTAHLVIDTRTAKPLHLSLLEDIIYGNDVQISRLPSLAEVVDIFSHSSITITDNGDTTWTAVGTPPDVYNPTPDTYQLSHPAVTDNGDGTFTATTGVTDG